MSGSFLLLRSKTRNFNTHKVFFFVVVAVIPREWLYLLCHEMLNPYYGLFQYSTDNIYMLQINPDSSINPVSIQIGDFSLMNFQFQSQFLVYYYIFTQGLW